MSKLNQRLIFFSLFLLIMSCYFFWPGDKITVSITEGSSASQVANLLKKNNVIISSTWFKILVKLTQTGKEIQPGTYHFKKYMSSEEVLWKLVHSNYINDIKVVIPEGWRVEQIAERLQSSGVTSAKKFLEIAKEKKLEGYLFPCTYFFKKNSLAEEIISIMKAEFDRRIKPLFRDYKGNLSEKEILTIASIVEREAIIPSERPLIAAVYLNRLKKNMKIEADPTVQYAIGYWKKNLSRKDLKIKSPYNTYEYPGLPPGPICNPGYDSVYAVLNPARFDALYFVSDRKGKHIFNVNFNEHLKAKKRIESEMKKWKVMLSNM